MRHEPRAAARPETDARAGRRGAPYRRPRTEPGTSHPGRLPVRRLSVHDRPSGGRLPPARSRLVLPTNRARGAVADRPARTVARGLDAPDRPRAFGQGPGV